MLGSARYLALVFANLGAMPSAFADVDRVTITVEPGVRQVFAGFGASQGNWGRDYQKLTPAERDHLSRFFWRGLRMKSLRLWINLDEYAPDPGRRLTADFRARYIDSGLIADARRHGVVDLLLAPDNAPPALKVKRPGGPADFAIPDTNIDAYATLIAEFIAQIRDETGVLINTTGLQNEPNNLDRIAPEQMPGLVKSLRAALDARGLQAVRIIAPEGANVDGVYFEAIDRLEADPAAWAALSGLASHSYAMAATAEAARRVAGPGGGNLKDYWMTEASDNGPEAPGDAVRAASLASRFLNDVNQRTTHWIHFIGFEIPDPNDNATRILAYTPGPLRMTVFHKYYYYHQLTETFDVGATFRSARGTPGGDMAWTYGKKPRLNAAAARNPDGGWAIGLSNFTAPTFRDDPDDNGGFPARTIEVTIVVPELAGSGALPCAVRRSGGHLTNASEAEIVLQGGRATLTVGPLELVTLRSGATGR